MSDIVPKSVQLFLFANQIVSVDSTISAGINISLRNKTVRTKELAAYLCAFSLLNLIQNKIIKAKIKKSRRLVAIPTYCVMVQKVSDIEIEGDLENLLKSEITTDLIPLEKVIQKVLKHASSSPDQLIISEVVKDACKLGLGTQPLNGANINGNANRFAGNVNFTPDRQKVKLEEGSFQAFLFSWKYLKKTERKLHDQLLSDCKAGIKSSRK